MKFTDFLDSATLHETFVFLAQNQGLSGCNPQKPEIVKFSPFPLKSPKFHHFRKILENSEKTAPKQFLEGSGGSLAAICWKPCYSYRNIEVFKPPGRTRNAPKHKKMGKSSQNMKNLQKS